MVVGIANCGRIHVNAANLCKSKARISTARLKSCCALVISENVTIESRVIVVAG